MGFHSNNRQEKCWSCEFFCGERKHKEGLFLGDSTETSSNGTCTCKRSSNCNKTVSESGWCSKYQKWGVLASYIAKKENEEQLKKQQVENERIERQMRYEQERTEAEFRRERERIESERRALEEERKKLEYERWYNSLSPEDKAIEDKRIEDEKRRLAKEAEERRIRQLREEEERRQLEEEERKRLEEQKIIEFEKARKRKKRTLITLASIFGVIVLTITGIIVGSKIKENVEYKNSSTGKFLAFLDDYNGYNNGILTEYVDVESRGRVYFNLEYNKNGWHDPWNKTYDFRVSVVVPPKEGELYTEVLSSMCFNLDGSDNKDSFAEPETPYNRNPNYSAKVTYSGGYVILTYDYIDYNSSTNEPTYRNAFYSDTTSFVNCEMEKAELEDCGWLALSTGFVWVNDLFNQATGENLYE